MTSSAWVRELARLLVEAQEAIESGRPTGEQLRLMRQTRHVTVRALARAAGLSSHRMHAIEAQARPTQRAVTRYLEALDRADSD